MLFESSDITAWAGTDFTAGTTIYIKNYSDGSSDKIWFNIEEVYEYQLEDLTVN
jgi:hypothetical protein